MTDNGMIKNKLINLFIIFHHIS